MLRAVSFPQGTARYPRPLMKVAIRFATEAILEYPRPVAAPATPLGAERIALWSIAMAITIA
jgi:hypothetical protein